MEKITKEVIKNNTFCILKVQRVSGGIKVFCRSKMIEDFFSLNGVSTTTEWYGLQKGYGYPFEKIGNCYISRWGRNLIESDCPNISFLRAVGLSEGIEMTFQTVISADKLKWWASTVKEALKVLWIQYMKPVEIEISISTRDLEV